MRKVLLLNPAAVVHGKSAVWRKPCPRRGNIKNPWRCRRVLSGPCRALIQRKSGRTCDFWRTIFSKGRGTGARGGDIAAQYIATQFSLYGLNPAGGEGTFLQKVPMVGVTPEPATTFALQPASGTPLELKPLTDYVAYNENQEPTAEVDADIVFVGYGVEAPEYGWDDYKGVDVKGKVLLMLVNEPHSDDPGVLQGQGAHLLRPLDIQVRGGGAQGGGRRDPGSSDRDGELSLGGGAQLQLGREVLPEVGREAKARRSFVGAVRRSVEAGAMAGQDLTALMSRANQKDFGRGSWREAEGAHGEQDSPVRVEQCSGDAAGRGRAASRAGGDVHRALRSPRHPGGSTGRQHLQRRRRQCDRLRHSSGDRAGLRAGRREAEALHLLPR